MFQKSTAFFFFVFLLSACGSDGEKKAATIKSDTIPAAENKADTAGGEEKTYHYRDTLLHEVPTPRVTFKYDTLNYTYSQDAAYDPDELMKKLSAIHARKGKCLTSEQEFDSTLCAFFYENYRRSYRRMTDADSLLRPYGFPDRARIVERCDLGADAPGRTVVLWLRNPKVYVFPDDVYSCPTVTIGNGYYQGLSYISLLDTKAKRIINTFQLTFDSYWIAADNNELGCDVGPLDAIPFSLGNSEEGFESLANIPYHVIGGTKNTEGLAQLLFPDDYNGDGKKTEFAFYSQMACMGCRCTVFGYSLKQDRLLQYDVYLKNIETGVVQDSILQDQYYFDTRKWVDYVFTQPMTGGHTRLSIDYRGRGGSYTVFDVHFNAALERFEGVCDMRNPDEADNRVPWFDEPHYEK